MGSRRKTVSRAFRELSRELLPGLDKNPAYWGLFERCLQLPRSLDGEESSEPGIYDGADALARIEGKQHLHKHKNYSGIEFLEAYRRDVAPIVCQDHSFSNHKTRRIVERGILTAC